MIATGTGTDSPCTLVDCKPGNPFRPLDRRWQQAGILLESNLRPRSPRDDEWVRRALRFRRAGARLGDMSHPGLTRKDPELSGAFRIQCAEDHRLRREIEARLLADQAPGEVASRCGVSSGVVAAFEKVFYDVRERLDHTEGRPRPAFKTRRRQPRSTRSASGFGWWSGRGERRARPHSHS